MTQIGGFIAPTKRPGEVGVHSLNHFSLQVPDMAIAEGFYKSFGLNLSAKGNQLSLRTDGSAHEWGVLTEGPHKQLQYISFGAFEEDFEGLRERLQRLGVKRLDPPPGFDSAGVWFRDPDGTLVEMRVSEKTSPHQKSSFAMPSVPGGHRGVSGRGAATQVRPRRLSHVLMFTKDVTEPSISTTRSWGLDCLIALATVSPSCMEFTEAITTCLRSGSRMVVVFIIAAGTSAQPTKSARAQCKWLRRASRLGGALAVMCSGPTTSTTSEIRGEATASILPISTTFPVIATGTAEITLPKTRVICGVRRDPKTSPSTMS